jgi:hypothetical protein
MLSSSLARFPLPLFRRSGITIRIAIRPFLDIFDVDPPASDTYRRWNFPHWGTIILTPTDGNFSSFRCKKEAIFESIDFADICGSM